MNVQKKIAIYAVFLIVGIILFSLSLSGILDTFWNGFGAAMVAVALMRLYSYYRYSTDTEYAKKMTTKVHDERNNYLAQRAAHLTVRWGLVGLGVVVIILQIAGLKNYAVVCGYIVCALLLLYWGSYMYLKSKN